jgi:hypothetical protein
MDWEAERSFAMLLSIFREGKGVEIAAGAT